MESRKENYIGTNFCLQHAYKVVVFIMIIHVSRAKLQAPVLLCFDSVSCTVLLHSDCISCTLIVILFQLIV